MVNRYKLRLTVLQAEIMRLLFVKAGTSLNQRAIARLLDVSSPAIMKALPKLEKEGLITLKQDEESKRWSIELNRDDVRVMGLKRSDNLSQLYESSLIAFLSDKFPAAIIILFGSYSYGTDTVDSDIDIAIITKKEKEVDLTSFNKELERNITIQFYESLSGIHNNLKNSIINGIVLNGVIEL